MLKSQQVWCVKFHRAVSDMNWTVWKFSGIVWTELFVSLMSCVILFCHLSWTCKAMLLINYPWDIQFEFALEWYVSVYDQVHLSGKLCQICRRQRSTFAAVQGNTTKLVKSETSRDTRRKAMRRRRPSTALDRLVSATNKPWLWIDHGLCAQWKYHTKYIHKKIICKLWKHIAFTG